MNKILTFIIGLLCGAIITTLGFMIYIKSVDGDMMNPSESGGMYRPSSEMGEPPEKPSDDMPEMPMN